MHIAISQNITLYDALFIAAAQKMNAPLYTADKKLCAKTDKLVKSKLPTKE
jgi:predicted nucleic acid-binding protein